MDKEKFVQRIAHMLYGICGCNKEESIEVLEEALKRAKDGKLLKDYRKLSKMKDDFKDIPKFTEQALKSVWNNKEDDI